MKRTVLAYLHQCAKAAQEADTLGRPDWADKHWRRVGALQSRYLPAGDGFNVPTHMVSCSDRKITFATAFQHESTGADTDWTSHLVTVKPGFSGPVIDVSGRDRAGIKARIAKAFRAAFVEEVDVKTFCAEVDA